MKYLFLLCSLFLFSSCYLDQSDQDQEKTTWEYVCKDVNPFVKVNNNGDYYLGSLQITESTALSLCNPKSTSRETFNGCGGPGWSVVKGSNGVWYLFENWGSGGNISPVTYSNEITGSQAAAEAYCLAANQ